jgi:uncharacterized SAM-binding protein YcdF (DUF218 family)
MIKHAIIKTLKLILISFGIVLLLSLSLSFTSYPYWVRYWLGTSNSSFKFKPNYIIVLGAGNMPGESNMIRLYYAAEISKTLDLKKIIIAQPKDGNNLILMRQFLINYGVDSTKIYFEDEGQNTREQALKLAIRFPEIIKTKNIIITSPEHMRRAIFVFRKVGFTNLGGISSFESNPAKNLSFKSENLGGKKYVPDVGSYISLRYDIWNYLVYEITCLREFFALGYYYLQGWI